MSSTLDAIPRCSAMLAFYLVAATTAAVGSPAVRTVALSGQQAPGAEPGSVFSVFDTEEYGGPALNNLGRTAFIATLAHGGGVDGTNDRGIWSEGSGSLALEVRDGEQAPGTPPGAAFFFLNDPQFNDAGQVAFVGTLAVGAGGATNANNFGVWITSHDSLLYVARAGDAAPGGPPGAVFNGFTNGLTLNESGQLAFQAGVFGGGGGIWLLSGGSLEPVVSSGEYAPGTSVGTTFGGINPPSLSDAGRLAFFSNLAIGADPPTYDEVGIWSGEPGSLGLAARRGAQAPGLPAGAQIDSFRANPLVNVAGNTLFYADLKPGSGGVTAANSGVVYIQRGGSLDLVLRSDRHAPGTPAGTRFEHFGLPFFNADDEVAFRGGLREGFGDVGMNTDNSTGIWAGDPGDRHAARGGLLGVRRHWPRAQRGRSNGVRGRA
jgi:hypothetical protein